jgi:hypothetical protein
VGWQLHGSHVDFENDASAFIAVRISGIITQEVLFSTPVRRGFLQEALIGPGKFLADYFQTFGQYRKRAFLAELQIANIIT